MDRRRAVAVIGAGFAVLTLITLLVAGWIQVPSVLVSWYGVALMIGAGLLGMVIFLAVRFTRSDDGYDFSRKTEKQLSEAEAFDLAHYILYYDRLIRIEETVARGTVIEGGEREDQDPVRLYELVFERRNRNEKVGFLMDLEQKGLQVDVEDHELMKETVRQVDNTRMVRGSKVENFNEALENARTELAWSLVPTVTEKEYEDGELVKEKERPALPYRKSESGSGGSSAES